MKDKHAGIKSRNNTIGNKKIWNDEIGMHTFTIITYKQSTN